MKSTYLPFILLAVAIGTVSCSDFLDRQPNELSASTFYNTDAEAEEAVNAVYAVFYNFYENHVGFDADCLSDDVVKGHGTDFADYNSFNTGQLLASNAAVKGLWADYYQGITRANLVLENVPSGAAVSEAKKKQVTGEAYFLRAYFYFQLVQRYGGVPLVLTTEESTREMPRASAEAVYAQIASDLQEAAGLLPPNAQAAPGRPGHGAAQCLYGLTFLAQNKFNEAYAALKPVVDNEGGQYNYSLVRDLEGMYRPENNNGPESVFEIQSRAEAPLGLTLAYNHWVRPRGMPKRGGLGFAMPTQSLYNEFEPDDLRREATILKQGDFIAGELVNDDGTPITFNAAWAPETGMNNAKYVKGVDVGDYQEQMGQNKKLIRYAEVLLAFAEAAHEAGHPAEAEAALLAVRQRAFGTDTPPARQADWTAAIRHERRVELATENRRYFDLVRWGIASEVLTADCKKHPNYNLSYVWNPEANGLYPVPQTELDVNKNPEFRQNAGY